MYVCQGHIYDLVDTKGDTKGNTMVAMAKQKVLDQPTGYWGSHQEKDINSKIRVKDIKDARSCHTPIHLWLRFA